MTHVCRLVAAQLSALSLVFFPFSPVTSARYVVVIAAILGWPRSASVTRVLLPSYDISCSLFSYHIISSRSPISPYRVSVYTTPGILSISSIVAAEEAEDSDSDEDQESGSGSEEDESGFDRNYVQGLGECAGHRSASTMTVLRR